MVRPCRRTLHAILVAFTIAILAGVGAACDVNPQLLSSANVFPIVYGVNADMASIIPNTPYSVQAVGGGGFFDLAEQLGINTLRITDIQWESTGREYSRAIWNNVFDEANRHHMHIVLLLSDGKYRPALEQARTLLDAYGLARSPALWAVDLYNEPDVSEPEVVEALHTEVAYVRHVAPTALVTVGGWKSRIPDKSGAFRWEDPEDVRPILDLVDVVSVHLYGFVEGAQLGIAPQQWTQQYLESVRQQARGKPILVEEFGAGNGLGPGPAGEAQTAGDFARQAAVYCGVLQEVSVEHSEGVIGAMAWIIAPRPPTPGSREEDLTGMAIVLENGRSILPAALVLFAAAHNIRC